MTNYKLNRENYQPKLLKGQIALTLQLRSNLLSEPLITIIDDELDIVNFAIEYDSETDETVGYAFDSTVELFRLSGYRKASTVENKGKKLYKFRIIKTNVTYQSFFKQFNS